ncbi:DNA polymerase I [Candidatus Solincola sp.]|nr:DNA polymerase I [Actinomycetota bacterium]
MKVKERKRERYVLVDGHSLAYRAYYALPADLSTSSGQTTNAVYGFVSMLIKILEELRPDALVVAFDKGRPEFRLERFEEYKAHRKPMPDDLREQMDIIRALLEAMDIPFLEVEGYEADDVLATLKDRLPSQAEVFVVTGDRDALQLVDDRVRVVANRKGITDIVVFDREKVREKYGVVPEQIVDYLALKGDTSDNIPGVPGVGEKTAAALIQRFGDLDEIYRSLDRVDQPRWRRLLEENRDSAYLSRELARLRRDVPLELPDPEVLKLKPWDQEQVGRLFHSLEFRKPAERLASLRRELFPSAGQESPSLRDREGSPDDLEAKEVDLPAVLEVALRRGEVYIYPSLEGEGFTRGNLKAVTIAAGGRYARLLVNGNRGEIKALLDGLREREGVRVVCYRGKELMVQCAKLWGAFPQVHFDVQLASYLVNPSDSSHELRGMAQRYLNLTLGEDRGGQLGLLETEEEEAAADVRCALVMGRLADALRAEMNLRGLTPLFEDVEMPLLEVLAEMEICGVRLDSGFLTSMEEELRREIGGLEEEAEKLAGCSFNLNSPQQLAHVLFEVLGLPPVKRTKTGYATDMGVLNALRDKHPLVEVVLRHRELSKLLGTYVSALPRMVDPRTGRLHASFNQTVTATGRLSSSNPNLQNIPVRTPVGRSIRRAFIPTSEEGCILTADYSQIELRLLAHLSGDPGLRRAFEMGLDIHAATASEVFGVPLEEVDGEMRRRAKTINFGVIYGMSPFGLAEQLGIDTEEAERYIEAYFRKYPQVRAYLDRVVEEATRTGYVTTLLGRRREIPELLEGNHRLRRLGERLAFNTPIQGSAADIIKVAMVRVHRRIRQEGLTSRMILQVHDELVFDVEKGEEEAVEELVREEMENAYPLEVPLRVEVGKGPSWYEAK